MAEALALLGLASNIISFIDFGLKIASGARSVRESVYGTTAEVRELDVILEDVRSYNDRVLQMKASGQKLSDHEMRILAMVRECEKVAEELHKALFDLKVRHGRSKMLESGRVAVRVVWGQKNIDALRLRLEQLDQRIRSNVEHILQSNQNSSISTTLEDIKKLQGTLEINYDAKLDSIRDEIVDMVRQSRKDDATLQAAQLTSLRTKIDILQKEHLNCVRQTDVIRSLYFPVLRRRWTQIPKADQTSNRWIFDATATSFGPWLESRDKADGLFCITGRAGSGKSTLMKFIAEEPYTMKGLERWASPAKLCTATYYFWNQGYEIQKNQVGLFQSLLYQILKSAPGLIPLVCTERPNYEEWDVEELKMIFERVAAQTELEVRFCFFIDGLDEYNGPEEEVVEVLQFLSMSNNIKICASTRPRSVFERFFQANSRTFDVANFTKEDMKRHVRRELHGNENFQRLEKIDRSCGQIMALIADLAQGVWLWVYLVTRDLKLAVNRDEGVPMLRKIIHQFPSDLEAYFERIIKNVRPQYLDEMSQIFLITVDELQPLPLYAFSLLEEERNDSEFAVRRPIEPLYEETLYEKYPIWKSLIQNRCSDLLVVDSDPHPVFLSHPVDFLHRTVRDFLQDSYYPHLKANLKSDFNSTTSLCKMCLVMLKSLPDVNFKLPADIHKVIGLTDEMLYYAHETERTDQSLHTPLVAVLDEVDRVNTYHARSVRNHWTHARDSVAPRGLDEYNEGDSYNFLALTIQARLVKYVRHKLQVDPERMVKRGRPLLDYALRPRRSTPIRMPYHSQRDDPSVDVDMVRLLLENGADPNRSVHLNHSRTVWALFLLSIHESAARGQSGAGGAKISASLTNAWYQACELLIEYGAREDCVLVKDRPELTIEVICNGAFGSVRSGALQRLMLDKVRERQEMQGSKSSCALM